MYSYIPESSITRPLYDDNPDFNKSIDAQSEVSIPGLTLLPSDILYQLDIEAYKELLQEYKSQIAETFKENLLSEFPTPIAYNLHRFYYGAQSDNDRLRFLKDVWESYILLIHAAVVNECRSLLIPLSSAKIKRSELFSEKIYSRLQVVSRLLKVCESQNITLGSARFVNHDIIERCTELNRVRNEFSHSAAVSDAQASEIIATVMPELLSILQDSIFLTETEVVIYGGRSKYVGKDSEVSCETFKGFHTNRRYAAFLVDDNSLKNYVDFTNGNRVALVVDKLIIPLAPFLHFQDYDEGHTKRLMYLKRIKNEPSNERLEYEIIGIARKVVVPTTEFSNDMQALSTIYS